MAPTIIFIIIACIGILTMTFVLRINRETGRLTHHRHALILSLGLGLTTMFSFFITFLASGTKIKIDMVTIMFGVIYTLIFVLSIYLFLRIILYFRHRK
jgi:hypothetical protein